uniref:RNA-directed DNA polymerase, eukaryota n=1 Tax=Tanacetum cinerariifolium TaxID=118510 RepID=A0A699HWM5_TANCI|nr:RNA-directed DNA polymerase, eukaryota [Tanacetum cinerariifolium]
MEDRWFWDLNGDCVFRVKDVRILLDEAFLPKMKVPTRWIKSIPIKVNVFAWKLFLDRLPTRSNMARRNVSIPSLACPLCDLALEDSSHLFFGCFVAKDVQKLICCRWNLDFQSFDSYDGWLSWFKSIRLEKWGVEGFEGELKFSAEMGNRVNEGLDSNRVHVRGVSVNEHENVGLESSVLKNLAENAGVESFPTVSEAHGFHPHACANEVNMNDVSTKVGRNPAGNTLGMFSYANVTGVASRKALNFRTLFAPAGNRVDVVIPAESIRAINNRFANTAYGFFLGKRVAYPVVANYVRNTWGKYGLVKYMLNSSTGIFPF